MNFSIPDLTNLPKHQLVPGIEDQVEHRQIIDVNDIASIETAHRLGPNTSPSEKDAFLSAMHKLKKRGLEIINLNIKNETGGGVIPSDKYYRHVWNWDTVFVAENLAKVDLNKAQDLIKSLFVGQWQGDDAKYKGFIPHIRFTDLPGYYPGPDEWDTGAVSGIKAQTAGITQVPILATGVLKIYQLAKAQGKEESGKKFLAEVFDSIKNYHNWLEHNRDPKKNGLILALHPWEPGTDNSPQFDRILEEDMPIASIDKAVKQDVDDKRLDNQAVDANERPSQDFYYRAMELIRHGKEAQWDSSKMIEKTPFAIYEVLFNSAWYRANKDLAKIAGILGEDSDKDRFQALAKKTRESMNSLMWDEESKTYRSIDYKNDKKIQVDTVNSFVPLYAGVPDTANGLKMIDKLLNTENHFWTAVPFPSTAKDANLEINGSQTDVHEDRYWRGRVWINTNDWCIKGILNYAKKARTEKLIEKNSYNNLVKLADQLRLQTLHLVGQYGPSETYNCDTGEPGDMDDFAWTAAITMNYADWDILKHLEK